MDLSALFGGEGTVNPLAMVERVFQQVVDQLARTEGFAPTGNEPPDELIAVALGNRLARLVVDDQLPGAGGRRSSAHEADLDDPLLDELLERNLALAAALGACDCWGQEPGCPICDGAGGPGWLPPDSQLFAAYVYPAMRAASRSGRGPAGPARRNNPNQQEKDHVRHDGRRVVRRPDGVVRP
jgi:hypothetical protein